MGRCRVIEAFSGVVDVVVSGPKFDFEGKMLQTVILLLTLIFTPTWAQPPSRDWFLNFSDLIRDNKVDQAFVADQPKYKDFLNTPGMGDGTFTSLQWAAKVREVLDRSWG